MRTYTDYQLFLKQIEEVKKLDYKPSLLLHSCCAPCSCYPLLVLKDYFKITIFYNNSNIYPKSEYDLRLKTLQTYVDKINKEYDCDIKIVTSEYRNDEFNKILEKRKDDKEGSVRCFTCYALRYKELCEYASKNNYEYVCSVMTISRQKNSIVLNNIGIELSTLYPNTKYFISDFKKNKGIDKGLEIAKAHNMYRQDYCGCLFSKNKKKSD